MEPWGVLDYILEDGRLAIEGITGASAGAMNAVVLLSEHDSRRRARAFASCTRRLTRTPHLRRLVEAGPCEHAAASERPVASLVAEITCSHGGENADRRS